MFAVMAGGLKLPPYVIFKRRTVPWIMVPPGEPIVSMLNNSLLAHAMSLLIPHVACADVEMKGARTVHVWTAGYMTCLYSFRVWPDKADVEVLEDVQDEVEDGALPNLFDEDPADAPEPAATAEKQAVAELAREADQSDAADKEGAKAASFSNEEDVADQVMGGAVD
ncbi:unnamed protein product [Closterium sp. NIES-54]